MLFLPLHHQQCSHLNTEDEDDMKRTKKKKIKYVRVRSITIHFVFVVLFVRKSPVAQHDLKQHPTFVFTWQPKQRGKNSEEEEKRRRDGDASIFSFFLPDKISISHLFSAEFLYFYFFPATALYRYSKLKALESFFCNFSV